MNKQNKWNTLEHNGPLFPPEYEYKKYKIIVNDKEHILSKEAEEIAVFWAQKHATEYIKDPVCIKNFWRDFKATLPKELQKTSFPKDWNFKYIIRDLEYKKEVKKNRSKEEKKAEKEAREAIKEEYGYAILDGQRVPLGNYMVEPPGLFMGRGDHPLRFSVKARVYPEDVTINCSIDKAPTPPEGHSWKGVEENKNKVELAGWNCKLTGKWKPILFNAASAVKQGADQAKFNKAVKLAKKLDYVNQEIDRLLDSNVIQTSKLATVAKLISELAIRIGDEKGEDEADTVGASSLRVEHIKVDKEAGTVEFDFLGKDSVRYHNIVKFNASMVRNMAWMAKDKKPSDSLFPGINSTDVNEFFGNIIEGITAKMFRTAYGSKLLAEELAKEDVSDKSPTQKLKYFTNANLTVAKKLNHQTAVSPAYKEQLKKMKDKVKEVKKELSEKKTLMKEELATAKARRDDMIARANEKYSGDKKKDTIRRAKASYKKKEDMWYARIERLKTRLENTQSKIDIKEKTKGVALGTSKTNYSDPRIAYSYCKANDLEVKRIFTPTLQRKFEWAEDVSEDFYKNYPEV